MPTLGPSADGHLGDLAGGDADVALAGADDARAVRAEQAGVREVAHERVVDLRLVLGGDALGDADDEPDAGGGRFEDGARRELRRHGDERRGGAGRGHRVGDRVEDRDAVDVLTRLAGRDAADDLGAVVAVAQAVVLALPAGEALDDDLGVLVDEDCHDYFLTSRSQRPHGRRRAWSAPSGACRRGCRHRAGSGDPPRRWCRRGG